MDSLHTREYTYTMVTRRLCFSASRMRMDSHQNVNCWILKQRSFKRYHCVQYLLPTELNTELSLSWVLRILANTAACFPTSAFCVCFQILHVDGSLTFGLLKCTVRGIELVFSIAHPLCWCSIRTVKCYQSTIHENLDLWNLSCIWYSHDFETMNFTQSVFPFVTLE